MLCFRKSLYPIFLLLLALLFSCSSQRNEISFHYLGHSSFFIDFGASVTVLCDYGKENAYLEWGWDSPIYDAGLPGPDLLVYSHTHDDHYDPDRAASYDSQRIMGDVDTTIGELTILSFPSSEADIGRYDNHSYLFTYKGIRVLHLGDCQADIMMINDPAQAWNIEQRYPKGCDIVIMPIESTMKFIPQAVSMARLLDPKVLLPSHYWSNEYKQAFIDELVSDLNDDNIQATVMKSDMAEYVYRACRSGKKMLIPDLTPSARQSNRE